MGSLLENVQNDVRSLMIIVLLNPKYSKLNIKQLFYYSQKYQFSVESIEFERVDLKHTLTNIGVRYLSHIYWTNLINLKALTFWTF